jgi:hypothetical protein
MRFRFDTSELKSAYVIFSVAKAKMPASKSPALQAHFDIMADYVEHEFRTHAARQHLDLPHACRTRMIFIKRAG